MKIYPLSIVLFIASLTACHTNDPLEKMNRKTYAFNTAVRPYTIDPLVATYTFIVPSAVSTMVINSKTFIAHTFSAPIYALKAYPVLDIYNRVIIDLFLGGAGSTSIADSLFTSYPAHSFNSWPIVLPFMNPLPLSGLIAAAMGSKILGICLPSHMLLLWTLFGRLSQESLERIQLQNIALQADPYAAHIRSLQRNTTFLDAHTYALPEF